MKYFLDTETCGFHGMAVLVQYAIENGPVHLHEIWRTPVIETIEMIDEVADNCFVGFNNAFDWFHMCKLRTIFELVGSKQFSPDIAEIALLEEKGRFGNCLKPASTFDLMLHARKGPYQSTMDRKDVRIRRIPTPLAHDLAQILNKKIVLPDIYFDRRSDKTIRWQVFDIQNDFGDTIPDFKDIVLKFAPSGALKTLCADAGISQENRSLFSDVALDKRYNPKEIGFAPFCTAVGRPGAWNGAWPQVIQYHIDHWAFNQHARKYAADDVLDTRNLYDFFGRPEVDDDDDSILACMVAAVRWSGYAVDMPAIKALQKSKQEELADPPVSFNAPQAVKGYILPHLSLPEQKAIRESTDKAHLQKIAKQVETDLCECGGLDDDCILCQDGMIPILEKGTCPECKGEGCEACNEVGTLDMTIPTEAAKRAQLVLDLRAGSKELELYDKIIKAGRFHASFRVIGALSSRMSGADGLNAMGVKSAKYVRRCFPLADDNEILMGGDFDGFEVTIMIAAWKDPELEAAVRSGTKIHTLFGMQFYNISEELIIKHKEEVMDHPFGFYNRSKRGVFLLAYGGEAPRLGEAMNVPEEAAEQGMKRWLKRFPGIKDAQDEIRKCFGGLEQPGGIGTRVIYIEPDDYVESLFGFRRYFTLENKIADVLFHLAESPPKHWSKLKMKVMRRDHEQTAGGAAKSAMYGAAFSIFSRNVRAAGNHKIQSTGAGVTKPVQAALWVLQPAGFEPFVVKPMNIHDEIMCPTDPDFIEDTQRIMTEQITKFQETVPLLKMDWVRLKTWAEKS